MRRHLVYTVCLIVLMIIIFANMAYAKDYSISITDRTENKSITCIITKHKGHKVLVCSEKHFTLGPAKHTKEPVPIKKSILDPYKEFGYER